MSVWRNIGRAFGFGSDDPDPEESWQSDDPAESTPPAPLEPVEVDETKVHAIFHRVIEIFNNTLPDFLAKSTDPEKQRKFLYDSLDNGVKNYLADLQQRANEYCASQWQAERERLEAEAQQLRKRAEELEAKKSEIIDKQLSTDRQKRALSERVRDLEDQILKLEAEKEQLDIENKCMINKAKAAAVLENEIEELRQENLRLNNACQASDMRTDINDAMESEFKKQAAEATQELKKIKEQYEASASIIQQKDARIEDLQNENQLNEAKIKEQASIIQQKIEEIDALNQELEHAHANSDEDAITPEQLEEIQLQISRFEEVKNKLDARIEKLRANLKNAQAENQSLRESIKDNLLKSNNIQKELTEKIEDLTRQLQEKSQEKSESIAVNIPGDVDQLINGADWLVSAPTEESPMHAQSSDDDFGYQPPQRKVRHLDNDGQRSLFDL